ncbi:uncharacterized protein LOC108304046 [Cebus imitator]|uniref:uncharacterized protein LOC108304046 n=1 Tax=Cebus imitator TaxID=2715852 RepID=UPI00189A7572|nr:uncharacterized protein LOC108304046 [Cebus imitator]
MQAAAAFERKGSKPRCPPALPRPSLKAAMRKITWGEGTSRVKSKRRYEMQRLPPLKVDKSALEITILTDTLVRSPWKRGEGLISSCCGCNLTSPWLRVVSTPAGVGGQAVSLGFLLYPVVSVLPSHDRCRCCHSLQLGHVDEAETQAECGLWSKGLWRARLRQCGTAPPPPNALWDLRAPVGHLISRESKIHPAHGGENGVGPPQQESRPHGGHGPIIIPLLVGRWDWSEGAHDRTAGHVTETPDLYLSFLASEVGPVLPEKGCSGACLRRDAWKCPAERKWGDGLAGRSGLGKLTVGQVAERSPRASADLVGPLSWKPFFLKAPSLHFCFKFPFHRGTETQSQCIPDPTLQCWGLWQPSHVWIACRTPRPI